MRITHLIRIVLCGMVVGVVWNLLSALFLAVFTPELVTVIQRGGVYPRAGGALFFGIDLLMGIWAVWLYGALVPRYGAHPQTAAIVGVAWWVLKSLQSAKWVGLGLLPRELTLLPLVTTLVAVLVASLTGAWLYDRVDTAAAPELTAP